MSKRIILVITVSFVFSILSTVSCAETETVNQVNEHVIEKASSMLVEQVKLRKEQVAEPAPERLELMRNMGMRVDNLEIQRIFIHLEQEPNTSRIEELESMGIILYLESWIPPVGAHPTGFILADMPIYKLAALADKDYIVRLETAERQLEPQNGSQPQ